MKNNDTIDILIPTFNCNQYLEKCLNSLLSQTYKNTNIIILDDGSTDASHETLLKFAKKNKNISVYFKKNENNISKARNFLLSKIQNKLFTFFDADDYAENDYFETLYNNLTNFDADISVCKKVRHKENKNLKLNNKEKLFFMSKNEATLEMLSSKHFCGTVYCKLFKTSLLQDIKFDESIHYGEDLDFCYKIFKNANKIVFSNKVLYHYIIRENSIVTKKFNESKLTCINCYENIINDNNLTSSLFSAAKSMQGLIATELLFYICRDKFKNKAIKKQLKNIISKSVPYILKNKNLPTLFKLSPLVLWVTKFM